MITFDLLLNELYELHGVLDNARNQIEDTELKEEFLERMERIDQIMIQSGFQPADYYGK